MKRINAAQNNDGTWYVIIKDEYVTHDVENGATIENTCISTTNIPRADIKITAYPYEDDEKAIFTLIV